MALERLVLRNLPNFFKTALRHRSRYFLWYYQESKKFESAVIVSKKTANLAVERNKFKRQVKAILTVFSQKNVLPPLQLAMVVLPPAKKASFAELSHDIFETLEKLTSQK